jgi:hypothetical protein
MVQFFKGSADPRDAGWGQLASALGMGLGEGINTYQMNRSLESLMQDKALKNAPTSERLAAVQDTMRPYGAKGQKFVQDYMQREQIASQEKEKDLQKKQNVVIGKILNKQPVTEQEREILSADQSLALAKHAQAIELQNLKNQNTKPTQASQPIKPDQLRRMQEVRKSPEYENASPLKKYHMLTDNNVSKENAEAESKISAEEEKIAQQSFETAYKAQENFINETTNSYKAFETETKPKLLQMKNIPDEEIVSPTAAVFLEHLGIPLGALENPGSELYQKLSQDLLKGIPETYGNRILKVEVDNFLKTIPTLLNSPEGRRMISSNILKLGEIKEVYYNEMRKQQSNYLDKNKPLPRDFQQKIFDQVKPQIDRVNNEFVKLSEIKAVPKDTIPFFSPNGEINFVPKEHAQWASENGGRRIW